MDASYVALDLELIDAPGRGREIIEIGAVRFRGEQELESFSTLVRTHAPLGHRVRRLTGLREEELQDARPLDEALAGLQQLVGTLPIVGQSVELDAEQLRRAGLELRNPLLDTFELAQLLLPGLPSYDLDTIARSLGIEARDGRHRALPDARLTMRVFNRLTELVRGLDFDTLAHICRLAQPLHWPLRTLFVEALRLQERALFRSDPTTHQSLPSWLRVTVDQARPEPLVPNERCRRLDIEQLEHSMQAGGEIARRLPGFEERPEQLAMLRAVAEAFNARETLLVEAGTGTGKSLAYLLPAAHFAVANKRRVVVSTNTINLQDQLAQKDLPALREATGLPLRFSVLKGRSNYLCLRRWMTLLRSSDPSPSERSLLIKTLLWLPQTRTGDRAELRLTTSEEEAWSKVSADAEACSPARCAFHRAGQCFVARARREADSSHIVVVNHSLLLADLATRSRVLPDYEYLIVDEAHHLEDEATAQLGWRVSRRELSASLERLWESGGSQAAGLVPRALEALRRSNGGREVTERVGNGLSQVIGELSQGLPSLFDQLRQFVNETGERAENGALIARLTPARRAQPAWSDVEIALDGQCQRMLRLDRLLEDLLRGLEPLAQQRTDVDELAGELAVEMTFWDVARQRLWGALAEARDDCIVWLSAARNDDLYVHAAPLHVGEHLRQRLFGDKATVILTSATLTTQGSFRYLRERLGLEDAREVVLGAPFDYRRAVLVYLPSDIPEPNAPGYQQTVERIVGQLIAALDGRTLVLFTSYSQLRATYLALKEPLEAREIILLGQRMDGASRARLLETFKSGERVALMGTTSFWEGVDVVGEALSCLVIARLPFTAPSDPVFQARSEAFDDPFVEYAVPQAILRFRQGFGRLIRSRSDRGVLVILDRRVRSRSYGRAFLESLPECQIQEGPSSKAAAAALDWLRLQSARSTEGGAR